MMESPGKNIIHKVLDPQLQPALVSDISSIMRGNIKFPFSISNSKRKKISSDISNYIFRLI